MKPKIITVIFFFLLSFFAGAQPDSLLKFTTLQDLSLEELMDIEVTSVSYHPEKLIESASAIQVLTGVDIHRSGVTRLPEALRLVPNLQVSQANSHDWAITARGFSGVPSAGGIIANKLLVMVDGRMIYTPLFGGVYWDVQNVLLQDIDHIEVVSGPGGTLWGANAVNGVINILSKTAKETQGVYYSGTAGSLLKNADEFRFGGKMGSKLFYRVYGQRMNQNSVTLSGIAADTIENAWNLNQGGFRIDYFKSEKSTFTLQGDIYSGDENSETLHAKTTGENILGRWTQKMNKTSNLVFQTYFDHAYRKTPNSANPFFYDLFTYDAELRYDFIAGKRHKFLLGCGYRMRNDETAHSFDPLKRKMPVANAFIQDEIIIIPDKLELTLGSKFLHNVFTGFEYQPSARIAWTIKEYHILWAAVSRVVRTPSRFDADLVTVDEFQSEHVIAYEAGYRFRPKENISFSISGFYNQYSQLRSIDSANIDADPELELALANSQSAKSWGIELSTNFVVTDWWRLRGGYTYFNNMITAESPMVLPLSSVLESVDPENTFMFQSIMNLPKNFQFDITGRYVSSLPAVSTTPSVPEYMTMDLRIAWSYKFFEFSLVGQNLLEEEHTETGLSIIPRSFYGKIKCRIN